MAGQTATNSIKIDPAKMPRIARVDPRFQSYNVEMVEVTGGRFWKPYASTATAHDEGGNQPAAMPASLYEYRKPIDLSNSRLRRLAAALAPAYLRVSGTWANSTYFQTDDGPAPANPPEGFRAVLTRAEWKGAIDFSNAVDAPIVTSFAISSGARDASGAWTSAQAKALVDFTRANKGVIAAAEYMNEPTMPEMGGAPQGYDAKAFARDVKIFKTFLSANSPQTLLLGPGGVGEGSQLTPAGLHFVTSDEMLKATGPIFDVFSYHTYGAVSSRCAAFGSAATTSLSAALSEEWLARGDQSEQVYSKFRDQFLPGKPMWNTETGQAACGGDRWASTFADTFRYLNQLGALARRGVQVQLHNTLAASDYGLLEEYTYQPRPDYWAALLWRKLMGITVLDAGASPGRNLHLYAHCERSHAGGVVLLAINASEDQAETLELSTRAVRYTLTAKELTDRSVQLNGVELKLGTADALPALNGENKPKGSVTLAPRSITFLAMPGAKNAACRD